LRAKKLWVVALAVIALAIVSYALFKTSAVPVGVQKAGDRGSLEPLAIEVSDIETAFRPLTIESGDIPRVSGVRGKSPPLGLPLSISRAALTQLSDQGDPRASCRLALELVRCRSLDDESLSVVESLASQGSPVPLEVVTKTLDRADDIIDLCRNAGEIAVEEPEERARHAAVSGGVRHRVLYALMSPEGMLSRLHNPEGIVLAARARNRPVSQLYADNARRFLDEGFVHRDLLALEGLILAHVPSPVTRIVPLRIQHPDPFKFAVFTGLYESLGVAALPHDISAVRNAVLAAYPPEVRAEVDASIAREHIRWSALTNLSLSTTAGSPAVVEELCGE
jgi:hypothetical protein